MNLTVRPGTAADQAFVRNLARRTVGDSVSSVRPAPPAALAYALAALLDTVWRQSHVMLVAVADGEPAGFLLMLDELPDEVTTQRQAFIAYMAVEPQLRRHGVGDALMEAAESEARDRGLPIVSLMVTEENAPARELYASRGYGTERRLMSKPL